MSEVMLELEKRDVLGKRVKDMRKQGLVPAVIHDHGKESIVVMGDYQAVFKAWKEFGKHHPVQLKADGKTYTAIIKSVTFDPRLNSMTHVVFNAVKADEKVTTDVPVRIKLDVGNESTPAERAGFMVIQNLATVEIEAIATRLPDFLEFDGEKLQTAGDHATAADLVIPKGVVLKTDLTQTIASVLEPSAVAAANDAAGGAAEEVVAAPVTEEMPAEAPKA